MKVGCRHILTEISNVKHIQSGIALIQVLLITAILAVLALYMTQTAQSQLQQALWADDKAQAEIALHGAESKLLFELLTKKKVLKQMDNDNIDLDLSTRWNFYSVPFNVTEFVVASIQDQSGLINLHYPNIGLLKKLIATVEPSDNNVEVIVDSIMDWQDLDSQTRTNGAEAEQYGGLSFIRNGAVPSVYDIVHLKTISPKVQELLIRNTTRFQVGALSIFNAAPELLSTFIDDSTLTQVVTLRESNHITTEQFQHITGIKEEDRMYYYTSNYLMIDLTSEINDVRVHKKLFIYLEPYAEKLASPITYL